MHAQTTLGPGHPLTEMRGRLQLSLQQLADKSGVDKSTIHKIESGHEPGVSKAIALARAVGMTVEDLWGADVTTGAATKVAG